MKPDTPSMVWRDIGEGGVSAEHDQGDFDGAIVTTAQVVQGGNGLWTPCLAQDAKGRRKKNTGRIKKTSSLRVRGKCVASYCPGQVATREEAINLCERKWEELFQP